LGEASGCEGVVWDIGEGGAVKRPSKRYKCRAGWPALRICLLTVHYPAAFNNRLARRWHPCDFFPLIDVGGSARQQLFYVFLIQSEAVTVKFCLSITQPRPDLHFISVCR
jgi:hypothetical protein